MTLNTWITLGVLVCLCGSLGWKYWDLYDERDNLRAERDKAHSDLWLARANAERYRALADEALAQRDALKAQADEAETRIAALLDDVQERQALLDELDALDHRVTHDASAPVRETNKGSSGNGVLSEEQRAVFLERFNRKL